MMNNEGHAELDVPAQITIALVEFVQTALAVAARSYWRVLPSPLPLRRPDVVTTLASLPKPIRVAPLAQPGALGTWPYTPASDLERTLFEQRAAKVQSRVREILEPFTKGGETVRVLLAHESTEWLVPSDAVEQWSRDYVLDGVGWILVDSGGDPRAPVRFILSRPDGTWYPAVPHHTLGPDVVALLDAAEAEAVRYQQEVAGTEHVLLALTRWPDPVIQSVLEEGGVSYDVCDQAVSRFARRGPTGLKPRAGARSSRLRNALESAARLSLEARSPEVGTVHLFQAMLSDAAPTTLVAEVLRTCGQSPAAVAGRLPQA
jgi:Clp amino terminal domain, pathogenicity island component